MRKNIDISDTCNTWVEAQADKENRAPKNLIETQLEAMASRGKSYIELWSEYERVADKLAELNN